MRGCARDRSHEGATMQKVRIWMAAAAALFAGLGFGAAPSRAQICGALFDHCQIAEDVLDLNFDQFEGFFPLDEEICGPMALSMIKQCESAVKAAVKCWTAQANALPKTAKSACKAEIGQEKECNEHYKDAAKDDIEGLAAFEESELQCCSAAGLEFAFTCAENP